MAARGWFSQDDLHNFGVVRSTGLSWSYLNQSLIGGHWAPGGHVLIWLVSLLPLNWTSPAFAVTIIAGVVLLGWFVPVATRSDVLLADHSPALDPGSFNPNVQAPKYFLANTREDINRLTRHRASVAVFDEPLPVLLYSYFPYGLASRLIPQVSDRVSFDGVDPSYQVDPSSGHVVPATLSVRASGMPGTAPSGPGAATCIGRGQASPTTMLAISPALTPGWWTGRLRLVPGPEVHVRLTAHNSRATYEIGDPPGWPDGRPVPMTIPSGARMFVFSFLAIGTVQRMRVAVVSHDALCLVGPVDFGTVVPTARL